MPSAALVSDCLSGPGEHFLDEGPVGGTELIATVLLGKVKPVGERRVRSKVGTDVGPAALDEVACKTGSGRLVDLFVVGKFGK